MNRFICFRYTGQLRGTEHFMGFFCLRYTEQLWASKIWCVLSVLDILNHCGETNIWWLLSVLDILDNCGGRTFDAFYLFYIYWRFVGDWTFDAFYLFYIYWIIVGTEDLVRFICFRYTGQMWGLNIWCVWSVLDILDNCGDRTTSVLGRSTNFPCVILSEILLKCSRYNRNYIYICLNFNLN